MVSRIASLRLQLIDAVSGPARGIIGSSKALDAALARLGKAGVPGAKKLQQQLEALQRRAASILEFREARRGLKDASLEMKLARTNVQRLQQALQAASKPTKKMEADLRTARTALKQATSAFMEQGRAVRAAEQSLRSYGINGRQAISKSQQAIRDEIAKTIREIRRLDRETRAQNQPAPRKGSVHERSSAGRDLAVGVVGGAAANAGRTAAQRGFGYALDFSQESDFQAAIGGFSDDERAKLNRQAEKIGGDTRFSNADVVRAQTNILQGGVRAPEQIMALTEQVTDYALAMGVTLEEGAETIRGAALSKRVDLSDAGAIKRFVDFMVWMAKNSGMSDDDVRQYMKYGGAATTGAGLPDPYSAAIAMILRRSGVRGDEAGVFARSASSKLVAPTNKGRRALYAMGINYDDFTTMPDAFNTKGLGIMMKNEFGKAIPPEIAKQIDEALENEEFTDSETGETKPIAADRAEFTNRMMELMEPMFGGKLSAKDANTLAKSLGDYHKMSVESVDTVALWNAIMSKNPSLAQLNAFFTDRQGGRANMIAQQWPLFLEYLKKMEAPPENVAHDIGEKANSGLYGDWTRMVGTIETGLMRAVQDWEFALRPAIRAVDQAVDAFIQAPEPVRRLAEAAAVAATVLAGFAAYKAGAGILGDLLGKGGGSGGAGSGAGGAGGASGGSKGSVGAPGAGRGMVGLGLTTGLAAGMPLDDKEFADFVARNHERSRAIDDWLTQKFGSPKTWRDKLLGMFGGSSADGGDGSLEGITASWPEAARKAMGDYTAALMQGGGQAEAQAQAIGQRIKDELAVTGHPDVDTARLEHALSLARQIASAVRGSGGGGASSTPPNSNPTFGGPRAAGGPVKKGVTYLVGEKGPEPFTPGQNGHITSNRDWQGSGGNRGGGSVVVKMTNHFHIGGGATKNDAEELSRVLDRQLNRSAQVAFSNLKYGDA